jgi:uncharacterized protein
LWSMSGLNSREAPHRQREWGTADKFSKINRLEVSAMLREDINSALKDAMKAGEARRVSTLRLVNSSLKNADIEARGQGKPALSDEDALGVLQKMIKQRHESVELYEKGGRPELAAQEREEITIISKYLPQQMTDQEIHDTIGALLKETGATAMKDMGRVMAALKERYAGKLDFAKASGAVKKLLSGG